MPQSKIVRKYDTYKDSGIEWLGEIPQEWKTIKFKYCFSIIGGNGFPEKLQGNNSGDIPFCKCSDINDNSVIFVNNANNYISSECCKDNNFNLIPENSILIAKIGEALKKNHRKINTVPCCIDNNMEAFVFKQNVNNLYYFYVLKCVDMLWFDNGGTIPSVNNEKLKNFKLPYIKTTEQQQIADYLDKKCGEIDKVVEAEKSVIEKLKEYKQSIITEAVTKGLDKSVPLKDSGIEWIGKIPQHWESCKLLKLYKERKCKNKGNIETNVLSLSYGNIKKRNVESNMGLLPESFETYNIIIPSNIVLRLTDLQNDHKSLRCGLVKEQGIITSAYVTLEKKIDNISSDYYYRLLHTFDIKKGFYGMGDGVRQNLKYDGELCNLLVIKPPCDEQQQIADYLDQKCSEIDKAIADKEQLIEKFTEYKKTLIYECVTGKRKVVV